MYSYSVNKLIDKLVDSIMEEMSSVLKSQSSITMDIQKLTMVKGLRRLNEAEAEQMRQHQRDYEYFDSIFCEMSELASRINKMKYEE